VSRLGVIHRVEAAFVSVAAMETLLMGFASTFVD
jgi:hypothetical protein